MDDEMDNKPYFLALNYIKNVGPKTVAALWARWPDLSCLFKTSALVLIQEGLPETLAHAIAYFDFKPVDLDLKWEQDAAHRILTLDDPNYPPLLKQIYDPPAVLYIQGSLAAFDGPTVGIVGTRNPSAQGAQTAWQMAKELAIAGVNIISGLAVGIDAKAHEGCLAAGGRTVAVLGSGLHCIYPAKHSGMVGKICEKGAIISEFSLKTAPLAGHFPRRNRIISGLSLAILVVEAAIKSGSLITARFGLEHNRDVLAVPGSIHNVQARGCNFLLQQGAKLALTSMDVLQELGLAVVASPSKIIKTQMTLACAQENLVQFIDFESTSVDQMVVRSGLDLNIVVCQLAELELQGLVSKAPGGYTRCIV